MSDLSELAWMAPPLAICLILTGIHGYLGIHVLSRKVIFVDLAMAQIAALGASYAFLLGYDARRPGEQLIVYFFSLGFTLIGAAVFALTRMRHEKVAQEAIIGITYASATAIAMLMLSKSTGEGEHLKQMLAGNVLLVTWPEIFKTAAIYAAVGAFHWVFRKQFFMISFDLEGAAKEGLEVRFWDFLFYVSFGVVITSSVAIAGVLLVFSYLIIPAVIAVMFAETISRRIAVGWIAGAVVSLAGMILSYYGDLPTGPAVVACFAALLVAAGLTHMVMSSPSKLRALAKVAIGAFLVASLGIGSMALRKRSEEHTHEVTFDDLVQTLHSTEPSAQLEALNHLAERRDAHAVPEILELLRNTSSDRLIEHIAHVLPSFQDQSAAPILLEMSRRDYDPFLKVALARAILELKERSGIPVLIDILESDAPELARGEAVELLRNLSGKDFGYRPQRGAAENREAIEGWHSWWAAHGSHLKWREQTRRFE